MNRWISMKKIILDVDTGIDDAQAIMFALSLPTLDVIAITCVKGNVDVDIVCLNTLRILRVCDRLDVSITCSTNSICHISFRWVPIKQLKLMSRILDSSLQRCNLSHSRYQQCPYNSSWKRWTWWLSRFWFITVLDDQGWTCRIGTMQICKTISR